MESLDDPRIHDKRLLQEAARRANKDPGISYATMARAIHENYNKFMGLVKRGSAGEELRRKFLAWLVAQELIPPREQPPTHVNQTAGDYKTPLLRDAGSKGHPAGRSGRGMSSSQRLRLQVAMRDLERALDTEDNVEALDFAAILEYEVRSVKQAIRQALGIAEPATADGPPTARDVEREKQRKKIVDEDYEARENREPGMGP